MDSSSNESLSDDGSDVFSTRSIDDEVGPGAVMSEEDPEVDNADDTVFDDSDFPGKDSECISDLQVSLVESSKENQLLYTLLSSVTAAVGLVTNNPATIIGSMLLSPIGDFIVKLSIIKSFNSIKGKCLARDAFHKKYLERLGIDVSKVTLEDDGYGAFILKLRYLPDKSIDGLFFTKQRPYYRSGTTLYSEDAVPVFSVAVPATKQPRITHKGSARLRVTDRVTRIGGGDTRDLSSEFEEVELWRVERGIKQYERQMSIFRKYKLWDTIGCVVLSCAIAIAIGVICGMAMISIQLSPKLSSDIYFKLPTKEMHDRSHMENAIGMIFIAFCAGFILPEATRSNNAIRLVGVSVATALLPPLVNFGLYLGIWLITKDYSLIDVSSEDVLRSMYMSATVFVINFVILFSISVARLNSMCSL